MRTMTEHCELERKRRGADWKEYDREGSVPHRHRTQFSPEHH